MTWRGHVTGLFSPQDACPVKTKKENVGIIVNNYILYVSEMELLIHSKMIIVARFKK